MILRSFDIPRYFIVICVLTFIFVAALCVNSMWKEHKLKQLLISKPEFETFLEQAKSQRQLNKTYNDLTDSENSPQIPDGIAVEDREVTFNEDYVFPGGFFKGLTVKEARAKIPEINAQIVEWNKEIETDKVQFDKDRQQREALFAQADEDYNAIMEMANQ